MKKILLFLLMQFVLCTAIAQTQCSHCGGTGKIVKNMGTSQYGLSNDYKVKCQTCGGLFLKSTGHTHIHCQYCGGKGLTGSSSSSSKTYSSGRSGAGERLNELAYTNPDVYNSVMTAKFGLPISEEEQQAINELDSYNAQEYLKWRELLNMYTILYNQGMAFGQVVEDRDFIQRRKQAENKDLSNAAATFSVTSELRIIAEKLIARYERAYEAYFNHGNTMQSLKELEIQILENKLNLYPW